ncbi:hypothetical protein BaRGS_00035841, partial [Batillaria attramentaria]
PQAGLASTHYRVFRTVPRPLHEFFHGQRAARDTDGVSSPLARTRGRGLTQSSTRGTETLAGRTPSNDDNTYGNKISEELFEKEVSSHRQVLLNRRVYYIIRAAATIGAMKQAGKRLNQRMIYHQTAWPVP